MKTRWFITRDGVLIDNQTGVTATNITDLRESTLLAYANVWDAFVAALRSGDERVDDVIERAGVNDA